jgi:hypothetical protein
MQWHRNSAGVVVAAAASSYSQKNKEVQRVYKRVNRPLGWRGIKFGLRNWPTRNYTSWLSYRSNGIEAPSTSSARESETVKHGIRLGCAVHLGPSSNYTPMEPFFLKLLGSSRIDHTSKVLSPRLSDCLAGSLFFFLYVCVSVCSDGPSQVGSTFLIEFEDVFKEHRIFSMQFLACSGAHTRDSLYHLNNGTYSNSIGHDVRNSSVQKNIPSSWNWVCTLNW